MYVARRHARNNRRLCSIEFESEMGAALLRRRPRGFLALLKQVWVGWLHLLSLHYQLIGPPTRHTKTSVFSRGSVEVKAASAPCAVPASASTVAALTPSLNRDARTALGWVTPRRQASPAWPCRAYSGALRRLDAWLADRRLEDATLAAYLAELHDLGRAPASASTAVAAACFRARPRP